MANCVPSVPAVPNDAFYPVAKLYLVPSFDRASYRAAFGEDPATYDATRMTKTWFDSTAIQRAGSPDALVQYTVIERDASGNVVPRQISMTAREAATVNLYGIHSYPAYQVAPTEAVTAGIGASINAVNLSMYADAVALAASFGLDANAVRESALGIAYPADELRRLWLITYKGFQLTAGTLLFEMNQNGAGAPGRWDLTGAEPNWISQLPSSLPPQNPAWGIPCRPLAENEAIAVSLFGFMVYRKDKASAYNPSPVVAATSLPATAAPAVTAAASAASPSLSNAVLSALEQNLLAALKSALLQVLAQKM